MSYSVVTLGLTGRKYAKNRMRIIGANFARTQGRFRANFVKRVLAHFASQPESHSKYLELLADAYSKIEGKVVSADVLREEAQSAK